MVNPYNKATLRGQIISPVRLRYSRRAKERLVYFTLAVSRYGLTTTFNKEPYNYFYCFASEKTDSLTFCQKAKESLNLHDIVQIEGFIDNRINHEKQLKTRYANFQALSGYISTFCFNSYKIIKVDEEMKNRQIALINSVRKSFDKNANIEISPDAFEKTTLGVESDDLPDY